MLSDTIDFNAIHIVIRALTSRLPNAHLFSLSNLISPVLISMLRAVRIFKTASASRLKKRMILHNLTGWPNPLMFIIELNVYLLLSHSKPRTKVGSKDTLPLSHII